MTAVGNWRPRAPPRSGTRVMIVPSLERSVMNPPSPTSMLPIEPVEALDLDDRRDHAAERVARAVDPPATGRSAQFVPTGPPRKGLLTYQAFPRRHRGAR